MQQLMTLAPDKLAALLAAAESKPASQVGPEDGSADAEADAVPEAEAASKSAASSDVPPGAAKIIELPAGLDEDDLLFAMEDSQVDGLVEDQQPKEEPKTKVPVKRAAAEFKRQQRAASAAAAAVTKLPARPPATAAVPKQCAAIASAAQGGHAAPSEAESVEMLSLSATSTSHRSAWMRLSRMMAVKATAESSPSLAKAWQAGGEQRLEGFRTWLKTGCNMDAAEQMIRREQACDVVTLCR